VKTPAPVYVSALLCLRLPVTTWITSGVVVTRIATGPPACR